jgi:hypothetical protein
MVDGSWWFKLSDKKAIGFGILEGIVSSPEEFEKNHMSWLSDRKSSGCCYVDEEWIRNGF